MKNIFLSLLTIPLLTFAQIPEGYHEHDGFFLSMCPGIGFGPVTLDATGTSYKQMEISGTGFMADFKIGGTLNKTVSLSFDVISRSVPGPTVKVDGVSSSTSSDVSSSDVILGLGITYYLMPANILFSGTIGTGNFSISNKALNTTNSSENGFGLQLKVGKEWWTGNNWGLGISGGFAHLNANDKGIPGNSSYSGKMSSDKIFILFNTTYN